MGAPLLYAWHKKVYLGAAHGLCGELSVLLQAAHLVPEVLDPAAQRDVLATLDWVLAQRLPSGNLSSSLGKDTDELVQFCHGATGLLPTLLIVRAQHKIENKRKKERRRRGKKKEEI